MTGSKLLKTIYSGGAIITPSTRWNLVVTKVGYNTTKPHFLSLHGVANDT